MGSGQLALGLRLRDSSVFGSYFAGPNLVVVETLRRVRPGEPPTCLWLQGPPSSGKTHLLQAMCASADSSVAYVPLSQLTDLSEEILVGYGQYDVLCLDDVAAVAGRDGWERALFRLHQELDEHGGRMVSSGISAPAHAGFRLRDLASRMSGGLVLKLQPLSEADQIAALQLRAQVRGFELPDDAAQFLMRRLPRDMASLCAFLDELDVASLAAQRRLTVPFVREVMEAPAKP
jgi:DnaA-homolog protein